MKTRSIALTFSLLSILAFSVSAQEVADNHYNDNSLRPIRNADIMHKNTVWKRVDLREKIHEPFFAEDNQITKVIVQAVKDGVLRPYTDDQLTQRMKMETFLENLKLPGGTTEPSGGWDTGWETDGDASGDGWISSGGDDWETGGEEGSPSNPSGGEVSVDEFFASQMSLLEFKVDVLFDRKRSRSYNDIQSVSIIIPGELYTTGIDKVIATFSYKELVENVFRDNPNARWYNPQNLQEHRSFDDAINLALYNGTIIKHANPKDQYIQDVFTGDMKRALGYAQQYKYNMLEFQENLNEN